jgi:enoyl-[acyl-carrier protein] reductase III
VQEAKTLLRRGSTVFSCRAAAGGRRFSTTLLSAPAKLLRKAIRYLALELAPLGVRANCVAPSAVDTVALRSVFGANADAILAKQAAENPSGRNLRHDDYCSLIENLASPQAEMIQGEVIFVTGGGYLAA